MIVFAVAFAVCGFSDQTDADSSGDNDNIHWVISGNTLTLSGTGNMDDYTFSKRPAWETDSGWSNVTKAVIESGITSIGSYVFNDCKQIVSVTLPDGITSVGSDAFSSTSINSATIPDSVISIGDRAFWQCTSLESVTLGKGLTSIGYGTFYECTKLGSVAIPDSVTSIGDSAFYNCTKLGSVAISNSVTSIGASAFYNCWYITSLTIPISLNQVGPLTSSPAFTECKNIESVVFTPGTGKGFDYTSTYQYTPWYQSMSHCSEVRIYNGVKSIGGYTFHSCGDLISLFVPNSVTSIGNSAFSGCIKLASFDISDSVTFLGDSAFSGCTSLKSVTIGKGLTSIGYGTFYNCTKLGSVAIPDSVTSIGAYAFRDCTSLSSLTIPISLDQVGPKTSEPVFAGCTNIASVVFTPGTGEGCGYESKSQYTPWYMSRAKCSEITIPDRVTSIGASAFQNCSSLVSLSIPDSVTSIGASAFQNCSSLVSLTIPISLNQVGPKTSEPVFAGCTNIASVVFTPGTGQGYSYSQAHEYTPWFLSRAKCSEITFSYGITSIGDTALSDCGAVRSLVIPDSVRSLEPLSFQNFTSLVSLTIPISLDQVGPKTQYPAFAECKNIESVVFTLGTGAGFNYDTTYQYTPWQISWEKFKKVTISDGTSYIGNSMFHGCGVLESVTIPDKVYSIGSRTFQYCTNLKSMTIPDSVTSIGSYAFQDCVSLESVVIGNGVGSLGMYAFQNCNSLSSLTAPISLNLVGSRSWSPVFSQCTKIKSVVFTPGTGEGYDYSSTYTKAPWYLSRAVFREVTISDGVRSIGSCTFRDCPSITSITMPDSVRSIGSSAFLDCSALGSVVISDGLTSIGNQSFYACRSLTSIAIPKSVTSIGSSAFSGCTSLASITVDGNNTAYLSEDGVLFNKAKTELIQYPAGNTRTSYTIPDSVTSLGKTAFCNCIHLTSVAVPESVTSIGNSAFSGCTSLTSITFMASTWAIDLGNESFSLGTSGMRVTAVIYSPGNAADGRLDAYGGSYTTFRYQSLMTVTFDVQGHGTAPAKQILSYGEKATRPADPTAEGYVFGGWYRESGCTNEWDFSSDTVTSDIILYAKWTAIRKVTVLVNDADWGSISITPEVTGDIIVDYGTPVSVLGNNLILGGYTVVATQNTSEKYSFAFSSWRGIPASGTVTEDIAITAVFSQTINEVRFAVNDPSMGEVSAAFLQNVPYETEVFIQGNVLTINGIKVSATPSDPTAQYTFVFDSWSGIPADHILREPVTLTAGFRAIVRTYTVTFDVNEKEWGTVGRDALQNVPYGQTVTSDGSTLTVNGSKIIAYPAERTAQYTYAFLGWEPSSGTVTGDMKVTAVFSRAVNVYTVTFDSSEGSPVGPQTVEYGQKATRPDDPVKEGKAFDGWYYDGSKWDFDTPIVSDIMLVAHWNNEYVVTFDVQGHGTAPDKQTLTEGGKVTRPPDPTDEGYLFGGWYRESSATNPWNFETDTVQDSMTLYAKWTLGECRISSDGSTWTYFATLGEGLQGCSDGWYLELMDSCPHSEVTIDKSITVIFSGKTFYSQHTVLKISADVTFTGMNQMPISATFATGACLTVDTEFPLTASFADVAGQAGKVFVRGLTANDVSVAHGGYSADGTSDAITLVRVTDFPYAVLDGGVFVFYATIGEAIGNCTDGHVYVLNYIPVYSGGTQVRTYDANASVDESIVLGTVTRVTDGVHSSFYIGTMEVYNNGASVGIPSGKVMYAEVGGELRITAGRVLTITDVAAVQDIILGGGRTDLLGEDPVAIVRLTEAVPSVRLTIGFENIGSWIVRTQTPEGYVYELKDGCDYTFITSDRMSLNDMVSVKAPGFKANIGPEGFSGKLVASQSMVAYVRTGESSYTGYGSIGEAIAAATAAGQYDSTVYLLYRTTDRTEDQPTIVHVMDSDLVFDGTFKLATVHQHVDAAGTNSTYSVDGSMAVLRFTEGHGIRINSDADLSKVLIEGVVNIQGANVIDLGGNWDSKILTLKLYAHEIGTVVKNAGDVQWNVISYPEEGCSLSKQGNDLVLSGPAPAPSSGGSPIIIICALAGIIILVIAAMCIVMVKRRS